MTAPSSVAAIGPCQWVEFGTGKMPAAGAAMAAPAINSYLVNEIGFLHIERLAAKVKVLYLLKSVLVAEVCDARDAERSGKAGNTIKKNY